MQFLPAGAVTGNSVWRGVQGIEARNVRLWLAVLLSPGMRGPGGVKNEAALIESARQMRGGTNRRAGGLLWQLLTIVVLALAFFFAPAIQGINLVADQSQGMTASSRAGDRLAAREAERLIRPD